MADDKGWSPIKGISQWNVSSRGFDWNELHVSVASWNTPTSISSQRFELSHISSHFQESLQVARRGWLMGWLSTCVINSLSDLISLILITELESHFHVTPDLCHQSNLGVIHWWPVMHQSPDSGQTSQLNLALPPLPPLQPQSSLILAREPFKALELHPFLLPDR